jgi:hypothetical protein
MARSPCVHLTSDQACVQRQSGPSPVAAFVARSWLAVCLTSEYPAGVDICRRSRWQWATPHGQTTTRSAGAVRHCCAAKPTRARVAGGDRAGGRRRARRALTRPHVIGDSRVFGQRMRAVGVTTAGAHRPSQGRRQRVSNGRQRRGSRRGILARPAAGRLPLR